MPWAAPIGSAKRHHQPRRAKTAARAAARHHAGGRRRHRRAEPCGRRRSSSAMTPCCSTPRSPKPPIPSRWQAPSASAVDAGRTAYEAGLMNARDFALPLHPCRWDTVLACRYPDRFYPVVDSLDWVERLTKLGVGTIHLRAKDLDDARRRLQIVSDALAITKGTQAKLVVNDYWRAAIVAGANISASRPGGPGRRRPRRHPRGRPVARRLHP